MCVCMSSSHVYDACFIDADSDSFSPLYYMILRRGFSGILINDPQQKQMIFKQSKTAIWVELFFMVLMSSVADLWVIESSVMMTSTVSNINDDFTDSANYYLGVG